MDEDKNKNKQHQDEQKSGSDQSGRGDSEIFYSEIGGFTSGDQEWGEDNQQQKENTTGRNRSFQKKNKERKNKSRWGYKKRA